MAEKELVPLLKAGIQHIRKHPQLWWTVLVAIIILIAFVFVSFQFIGIARDAQDRLVSVRVGSIQDAYVEFLPNHIDDQVLMRKSILNIINANPTIQDFKITRLNEDRENVIIASINPSEIGSTLGDGYSFLSSLAQNKPQSSFTLPINGSERFFNTIRAYTSKDGEVLGFVVTAQILSEADQIIDKEIQRGIITFIIIVFLVMFLFLRHAKIIDYVSLYQQLKEVDTLKDDFISMASHELRTPLTAIRGYAEFLSEDPALQDESKENLNRIDISAQQLDRLVADMLDVSRIEQGRMKFEYEVVDPRIVAEDVVKSLTIPANDKKLELSISIESSQPIKIDQSRLKQVLVNIVGNSVKYTLTGEVKVRLYTEQKNQIIRISDTGIGMDAESQKKLFQKFYRIKSAETSDIRGTGLGLWITKQIVEAMGGEIGVESIKGVGTHFILKFPIV